MAKAQAVQALFLGGEDDPVLELLRALAPRVAAAVVESAAAAKATAATGERVLVSVRPVSAAELSSLEEAMPVVLLGPTSGGTVALPREPLSAAILDLAIGCALDRFGGRACAPLEPPGSGMLDRFFEALPVGVALSSVDDELIEVNPALSVFVGYEREELSGAPGAAFGGAQKKGTTLLRLVKKHEAGEPAVIRKEKRFVRKDGSSAYAEVAATLVPDASGQPAACLRTVVDVTERREAEQRMLVDIAELRRAEAETRSAHEFLAAALRHMPVGVLIVERSSQTPIVANERLREILGDAAANAPDALALARAAPLVREGGAALAEDEHPLARALATGQAHGADDLWLDRPDGTRRALSVRAAPVPYQGREAVIFVAQDVTPLREQERQRRDAVKRHDALFEQATDAIFLATADWRRIVDANPAAETLFGYRHEELLKTSGLDLAPRLQPAGAPSETHFAEQVALALREGVARFSWRGQRNGGRPVDLELTVQPLKLGGAPDLVIVQARDVTQQRLLEDELRHSQKLEAVGLLAGGIAHDFNNLLTGVIGFVELAGERLPKDGPEVDAARGLLAEARRAAKRGVELTRQLLTFSRRSSSSPELMDLNTAVERTDGLLRRLLGETVKLEVSVARDGCPIRGDCGELEQAIVNLAINARDAMPGGGTLRIETRRYRAGDAEGHALGIAGNDYAVLYVSDTGTGMTDSVKSRLFEPFFTTKERGRGTGLGLAVVHGVVQRHGGRIFVDSTPGGGTRFTILIPIAAGKPAATAQTPPRGTPLRARGGESVLVVDDDPMVRMVTAAMLEALGYKVSKAASAAEALEAIATRPFDLLVTDMIMPDKTGVELARGLRVARPTLKVLLVSGYTGDAFARQGGGDVEAEGFVILPKPLTLESLGNKVREILDAPARG